MEYLTEAFRNQIRPFFFSEHDGQYSALLSTGNYRSELFREYYPRTGVEGNGYDWDALADLFIREHLEQYEKELAHDSEAGMFCLYSRNEKAVYEFLKIFRAYCEDEARFRDLMERADFKAWD